MGSPRNLFEALQGAVDFGADNLLSYIQSEQDRKRQAMLDKQNLDYRNQVLANQDRSFDFRQDRAAQEDERFKYRGMMDTLMMADRNKRDPLEDQLTQARIGATNALADQRRSGGSASGPTPSAARGDLNAFLKTTGSRLDNEVRGGIIDKNPDAPYDYHFQEAAKQGPTGLLSYLKANGGDDEMLAKADSNVVVSGGGYGAKYGYGSPQGIAERGAASRQAGRFNPEMEAMGREVFSDWDQLTDDQKVQALQIWSQQGK